MSAQEPGRITAVLGPTNTGKTHYAIERMLAHADGMIGLPLRLLAREVYDRVVRVKGERAVALVTGEEKLWPDTARYFVCTVEAMPLDKKTQFLAVDEIQLARDADRGHVFTDRLMRARGIGETLLLGSDTMRGMIRRLAPSVEVQRRERLSTLSYVGPKKLTKLPKRSAIVAFSAEEVYAIAELIRRQRGGAAVVMGALSPRTRNAQVALYQSGEVDFLVATDAIGMGLNMDVDHVAFASRSKFDGRRARPLRADEIAQIAGRAGRFRTDGTFGEAGSCPPLDEETVARVQSHEFESVEAVEWRNPALDFSSVQALIRAIERPPSEPGLMRARGASDEETLKRLADDPDLMDRIERADDVRRLWDVCLTPDFRKVTIDEHARLVNTLALHLLGPRRRIPQDWIGREIEKLDRSEGDIDALQARLAHIRTWTYAAARPDWIDDCEHWRGRTRDIENRLSDRLHDLLTLRFIDRRTSALIRGLKREDMLDAQVTDDGEVSVEGHYVGRLDGLAFKPDPRAVSGREARAVRHVALKALAPEVTRRLKALAAAGDAALHLETAGVVRWVGEGAGNSAGAIIARIRPGLGKAGAGLLSPRLELIGGEAADASICNAALERVEIWLRAQIRRELSALLRLRDALDDKSLPRGARGLAFRLLEDLGAVDRMSAGALIEMLSGEDRAALQAHGVRFGRHTVFIAKLGPKARRLLATLRHWTGEKPDGRLLLTSRRAVSMEADPALTWADYAAVGFRPAGPLAVRIERLEQFAAGAWAARGGPQGREFALTAELAGLLACPEEVLSAALMTLGYRCVAQADPETGAPARWRLPRPTAPRRATPEAPRDTPFAALATLLPAPSQPQRRKSRA